MTRKEELEAQIAIGNGRRPYLAAVGVNTGGWTPVELVELSNIVTADLDVVAAAVATAKANRTVMVDVLAAARELPSEKKAAIRERVEAAKVARLA